MLLCGRLRHAGGAEAAQALLKKRGFVRPEIVVWTDGAARNLSLDPEAAKVTYRVEITGTDALSDEVKGVIAATGEVYELSRVGSQLFVVGAFDDRGASPTVWPSRYGKRMPHWR